MTITGRSCIAGRWVEGQGPRFQRRDPVFASLLWDGAATSPAEVGAALQAAQDAFPDWRRRGLEARVAIARGFAEGLKSGRQTLAEALAEETGKPLWEALTEIDSMVAKVALSEQAYAERTGRHEKNVAAGRSVLQHRPHGVMGVLGPYNFPGHLPNGHIVPALMAGNTVVFKPSDLTPRFAELTVQLWQAAGLPAGVLNLVQGGIETGQALVADPRLAGLLFTGSSAAGEWLHRHFAGRPDVILALEMGGNNPLVVAGEWEERSALYTILFSAFVSAGQRCTCARRLLVPRGAAGDRLLEALVDAAQRLRCAAWNAQPAPFMGSLISPSARQRVEAAVSGLRQAGARVLLAPRRLQADGQAEASAAEAADAGTTALLSAAIVDVTDVASVPDEEVFGPLLQVWRYGDFDEALQGANATRYGLAAGLISSDRSLFDRFQDEVRAGIVNWNKPLTGASSAAPFGGVGASGNHRASAWYAADYCAWPMASLVADQAECPTPLPPGLIL